MAVLAVQAIRRMRGGAQSQLMLGADGKLWVVKFQNNPQHLRVLANELIATRLAEAMGLTVPATEVVEVTSWLADNTPEMRIDFGLGRIERCAAGLQFGSQFVGWIDPGPGGRLPAGVASGRGAQPGGVRRDAGAGQVDGQL